MSRWMYNVDAGQPHVSQSTRLETGKLRGWLARRRWVASCAAVRGVLRIARTSQEQCAAIWTSMLNNDVTQ